MDQKVATFTFKQYSYDSAAHTALFHYRVSFSSGAHSDFTERLVFPKPVRTEFMESGIWDEVLKNLHLALGISYYRSFYTKNINIDSYSISSAQANFFNVLYEKGLGEFFYRNQIAYHGLISFPHDEHIVHEPRTCELDRRALVPIGGGKDSIVTAELLKSAHIPFELMSMNTSGVQKKTAEIIGAPYHVVERTIDPTFLELLRSKSLPDGHIPITAIYGFVAVAMALLQGARFVVFSNEKSANHGNVAYLGTMINHQWSKSLEFESMMREYIHATISPDIMYFSLLRPLYESEVVRRFAKMRQYHTSFSSCNRNFAIDSRSEGKLWCGTCPKCAFVFTLLAASMTREQVVTIVGADCYNDASLIPLYRELLGFDRHKPFECVGTPEEVIVAFEDAYKTGVYDGTPVMKMYEKERVRISPKIDKMRHDVHTVHSHTHIPQEFETVFHEN